MNNLSLDYYQHEAKKFAIYKDNLSDDNNVIYPVLGLVSESGEVADKIKKIMRDTNIPLRDLSVETKTEISKELGDCLWYIAMIAEELEFDLSEIAEGNLSKLGSRRERSKLTGSGDNR